MYQYDPAFEVNTKLADELLSLTREGAAEPRAESASASRPTLPLSNADAIVAHIEVNGRHGVGVLLERLFGRYPNILSIRSHDHFGGRQDFGDVALRIDHEIASFDEARRRVRRALGGNTVGRILAVPYYPADVLNALAIHELTGAPLAVYLMDDQNIAAGGIPDELMRRLLDRAALRLAISPELAAAYEAKYGVKFWLMPPVVPSRLILDRPLPAAEVLATPRRGVILGNIWGQRWLDKLRETVRDTGIRLAWHSTNHLRYLTGSAEELAADGIDIPAGAPLPDPELVDALRRTAFAVVPTGTLGEDDDRRFIALLSLPSRIPFLLATAHLPVLVVGHEHTAAARFVQDLGIGMVTPYDRARFAETVEAMTEPATNLRLRRRALAWAARFTDVGAAEWIWQSLERGEAFDLRYEDFMRRPRPEAAALAQGRQKP